MTNPVAQVLATIVNAQDFQPLVSGSAFQCTPATLSMSPNPQSGVTLSGTAPEQQLTVSAAVDLKFTFAAGPTNRNVYYPVGLALTSLINGGEVDPDQRALFPKTVIDSIGVGATLPSLTLTDLDNDPTNNNYEFYIVIQRGSDGALGVIDPKISNMG